MKFIILIPARYESSRFVGKPLAMICGKTMIQRVYENCAATGIPSFVVTDSPLIEDEVKSFGGQAIRVDDDVPSGSERIALAYERNFQEYDYIINVQGDEPLLEQNDISTLKEFHRQSNYDITTLLKRREAQATLFRDRNIVKCAFAPATGQCLYFSRAPIPFYSKEEEVHEWYQHVGVYSYTANSLKKLVQFPVSTLEAKEKLEQLRALENGMSIGASLTQSKLVGVDTPEDLKRVEAILNNEKK